MITLSFILVDTILDKIEKSACNTDNCRIDCPMHVIILVHVFSCFVIINYGIIIP